MIVVATCLDGEGLGRRLTCFIKFDVWLSLFYQMERGALEDEPTFTSDDIRQLQA